MAFRIQMKVTVPDHIMITREVIQAIARAQRDKTAPDLKKLFKQTVSGWSNPPDFLEHQIINSSKISMAVYAGGPNKDQYALVNGGARRHTILPRNQGGYLVFKRGYRASTRPRILSSRALSRFGDTWRVRGVLHPGFEERAFDETIAEQYTDTFTEDMQNAIASAH